MRHCVIAAGFAGYDAPRAVFPSIVHVRGDSTGAVLGPGAMPVVVASGADGQTAHYCVVSTGAVLGHGRSNFLSWCRGRFLWSSVQKTINILLLLLNTMIRCPCCAGRAGSLVSGSLLFGVRCSPVEYQTTDFPGRQEHLRIQHSLVRQWIHVGVILRGFCKNFTRLKGEGGRSGSSPAQTWRR